MCSCTDQSFEGGEKVKLHSHAARPLKILYSTDSPSKCASTVNNSDDEVGSVRVSTMKHTELCGPEFINPWQLMGFRALERRTGLLRPRWGHVGPLEWSCGPGTSPPPRKAPPQVRCIFIAFSREGGRAVRCRLQLPRAADLHYSFDDAFLRREVSVSGIALKRPFHPSWELCLHLGITAGSPPFWQPGRAGSCRLAPPPIFSSAPCSFGNTISLLHTDAL